MGYESRIYIVLKSNLSPDENGRVYAQMLMMYDLCKMGWTGQFHALLSEAEFNTDVYFYDDTGNNKVTEDRYGDSLKELPIKQLIDALKADDDGYRRIKPLRKILQTLHRMEPAFQGMKILHYGY